MTVLWILLGFFLFVMAGVSALGYAVVFRNRSAPAVLSTPEIILARPDAGEGSAAEGLIETLQRIGGLVPAARGPHSSLRKELAAAGYRDESAVLVFYGIKYACAILGAIAAFLAAVWTGTEVLAAGLGITCGIGLGLLLPDFVLQRSIKARRIRLRRAIPSALDLLVLALEAGQGMDKAITEAARGLKVTHPDLSSELTVLHLELRTANSRADALMNLAERTGERELRKLVGLLLDTDRFGTSIGPALRDHAKYLRIRFRQIAQERARKTSVKLVFPVFFLIFPSVLLVTLGPAVILLFSQLQEMGAR